MLKKLFFPLFRIVRYMVTFIKNFLMSRNKRKNENPFRSLLAGELYKIFNRHPNKTFNHKQLGKLVKPQVLAFIHKQIPDYAYIEDLHTELREAVIQLLAELVSKGDLIESERGK